MKDKPIIFSGPMVRAILDGRKTQTRRVIKQLLGGERSLLSFDGEVARFDNRLAPVHDEHAIKCPWAPVGRRLWVRESFALSKCFDRSRRPGELPIIERDVPVWWRAEDGEESINRGRWRSPLHMPRWASRITLEVTELRVERLQWISPQDILAEGLVERPHHVDGLGICPVSAVDGKVYPDLRSLMAAAWDTINGKTAPWASNPWVDVIGLQKLLLYGARVLSGLGRRRQSQ
jgi:hypothetical protein